MKRNVNFKFISSTNTLHSYFIFCSKNQHAHKICLTLLFKSFSFCLHFTPLNKISNLILKVKIFWCYLKRLTNDFIVKWKNWNYMLYHTVRWKHKFWNIMQKLCSFVFLFYLLIICLICLFYWWLSAFCRKWMKFVRHALKTSSSSPLGIGLLACSTSIDQHFEDRSFLVLTTSTFIF